MSPQDHDAARRSVPGGHDAPGGRRQVARLRGLPLQTEHREAVRAALAAAETRHDETVAEWLRIARIPALPGQESARAAHVQGLLLRAGFDARILDDGNVEMRWAGTGPGAPGVLAAHLDALHAPREDSDVRREGDLVLGPGVLDDASGVVAVLRAARFLSDAGWKPKREVRVLFTVREEVGLIGAKSYLHAEPDLAAFVSVDGILGAVDHGATGIQWMRFRFVGRGGHTLLAQRTPSPSFAAGRAIAAIADLAADSDLPINVSSLEGASAPNAIPTEVAFTVDVRGDDPEALARMVREIQRVAREAASGEGVELRREVLQDLPAVQLPGAATSPLVEGTVRILDWLGVTASPAPRGSSDHNVALMAGVPGIAVGATAGRNAHAPEEVADVALLERGVKQCILLLVLLGENLPDPDGSRLASDEQPGVAQ